MKYGLALLAVVLLSATVGGRKTYLVEDNRRHYQPHLVAYDGSLCAYDDGADYFCFDHETDV